MFTGSYFTVLNDVTSIQQIAYYINIKKTLGKLMLRPPCRY